LQFSSVKFPGELKKLKFADKERQVVNLLQKIGAGIVVVLFLAYIAFAFQLGGIEKRLAALEELPGPSPSTVGEFPVGSIVAWAGKGPIPEHWAICDGQNGTPDLRDKFLRGGSAAAEIGDIGGVNSIPATQTSPHVLTVKEMPEHRHFQKLSGGKGPEAGYDHTEGQFWGYSNMAGGKETGVTGGGQGHSHLIREQENRPAFYTVLYIMKIK